MLYYAHARVQFLALGVIFPDVCSTSKIPYRDGYIHACGCMEFQSGQNYGILYPVGGSEPTQTANSVGFRQDTVGLLLLLYRVLYLAHSWGLSISIHRRKGNGWISLYTLQVPYDLSSITWSFIIL